MSVTNANLPPGYTESPTGVVRDEEGTVVTEETQRGPRETGRYDEEGRKVTPQPKPEPPPEPDYKPGSAMYDLGFRTRAEYRKAQTSGYKYGPHSGSQVPENTIVLTDEKGNPTVRVTKGQLKAYPERYAQRASGGRYRVPVRGHEGKELYLLPDQVKAIQEATGRRQFDLMVKAGIIEKGSRFQPGNEEKPWGYLTSKQVADQRTYDQAVKQFETELKDMPPVLQNAYKRGGIKEYNRIATIYSKRIQGATKAAEIKYIAELKKFEAEHIRMADGQYVTRDGFDDLDKKYQDIGLKNGYGSMLTTINKDNALLGNLSNLKQARTVWQILTPWVESENETFLTYLKGLPERRRAEIKQAFNRPIKTQEELASIYEAELKNWEASPLWARIFLSDATVVEHKIKVKDAARLGIVVKDKKLKPNDTIPYYMELLTGVAEFGYIGKVEGPLKVGSRIVKVTTSGPKDVGMSEAQFARFLKARLKDPNLTPERFKLSEVWGSIWKDSAAPKKEITKLSEKFIESVKSGKIKNAKDIKTFVIASGLAPKVSRRVKDKQKLAKLAEERAAVLKTVLDKLITKKAPRRKLQAWEKIKPTAIVSKDKAKIKAKRTPRTPVTKTEVKEKIATWDKIRPKKKLYEAVSTSGLAATAVLVSPQEMAQLLARMTPEQAQRVLTEVNTSIADAIATQVLTETQLKQLQKIQIATELQSQIKPKSGTAPEVKPLPESKPEPKPKITPAPTPAPTPSPALAPKPSPVPQPRPQLTTPPTPKPPTPKPPTPKPPTPSPKPHPPGGKSEKEKREVIKERGGAIAWPQGELNNKKVWHVITKPYTPKDHYVVLGEPPGGARLFPGPREAYKSITLLHGEGPDRPVKFEGGAIDPVVYSKDGKTVSISFVPDKKVRRKRFPKVKVTDSGLGEGIVETRIGRRRIRHLKLT